MSINKITAGFAPIQPIPDLIPKPGVKPQGQASFSEMLESSLKEVDDLQLKANDQIEGLVLKKEGVTPHGAMVALEKADVAFQLMSAIRGKIIRAYEEVIRTQV